MIQAVDGNAWLESMGIKTTIEEEEPIEWERSKNCGDWTRSHGGTWGWRTIRNGRIRWYDRWYEPDDRGATLDVADLDGLDLAERARALVRYDGRLESQRLLFYTYGHTGESWSKFIDSHVFIWGDGTFPGPHCVDGVYRWEAWKEVDDA